MTINIDTDMLLFRFNNYKGYSFIDEHLMVLTQKNHVWMLKLGKRSSFEKLKEIQEKGGWLILRSPKAEGGKSYLAHFTEFTENKPIDDSYPKYYKELLNSKNEDDIYFTDMPSFQWFRIESIMPIDNSIATSLVVSKTGKKVDDVISTTRTAVMFIKNKAVIDV